MSWPPDPLPTDLVDEVDVIEAAHVNDLGEAINDLVDHLGGFAPLATAENVQSGTSYTLVESDAGKLIRTTNDTECDVTVPPNSEEDLPLRVPIYLLAWGEGALTVVEGDGVTVHPPAGETLVLDGQYAQAMLLQVATDEWVLTGRLVEA